MHSSLEGRRRAAETRHAERPSVPVILLLPLVDVDTQIVRFFERKQLFGNVHAGERRWL